MKNDNNNSEEKKYKPKVEMKPTYRKKRWSKTVSSKTKPHTKNIRNPTNDNINNNINNSNNNTQKLDIIMANYSQARKMRRTRKTGSIYMVGISFLVFVFSYLGKGRGGGFVSFFCFSSFYLLFFNLFLSCFFLLLIFTVYRRITKITDQQKRQRLVNSSSSSNVLQLNNKINELMTMAHSDLPFFFFFFLLFLPLLSF